MSSGAQDARGPISALERRIGTWIRGKYRLDGILGVGGMAVVYAATHRNNKRFAVKILRPEVSLDLETCRRFVREGYVANTVGHEGAVAVIDDDATEDGAAFLVMELLEGETVETLFEKAQQQGRTLPLQTVLALAHSLLAVLTAAHAKGIVHRDIKPANVFVTRAGQLKVLDFGIARLRDDSAGATTTKTGAAYGSPAFMSPEQARGKASLVSPATDLWAVGASMFNLLSGAFVHLGETPQEVMIQCATTPARSLASVAPDVPADVVAIVDRALAFDRDARWASAEEMRAAIAAAHLHLFGSDVASMLPVDAAPSGPVLTTTTVASDVGSGRVIVVPGGPSSGPSIPSLAMTELQHEVSELRPAHPLARRNDRSRWLAGAAVSAVALVVLGAGFMALRGPRASASAGPGAGAALSATPLPADVAPTSQSSALPQPSVSTDAPPITAPTQEQPAASAHPPTARPHAPRVPSAAASAPPQRSTPPAAADFDRQ